MAMRGVVELFAPWRSQIRRRFVAILLSGVLALGYASAVGYVKLNERTLIFRPGDRKVGPSPSRFELRETRVTYPSSDGVTVAAWIVPAAGASPSDRWLLICHGNFGGIGYGGRPEFYASMRDLGVNLLAFDYRGFGESDGAPDERGLYDDATASVPSISPVRSGFRQRGLFSSDTLSEVASRSSSPRVCRPQG